MKWRTLAGVAVRRMFSLLFLLSMALTFNPLLLAKGDILSGQKCEVTFIQNNELYKSVYILAGQKNWKGNPTWCITGQTFGYPKGKPVSLFRETILLSQNLTLFSREIISDQFLKTVEWDQDGYRFRLKTSQNQETSQKAFCKETAYYYSPTNPFVLELVLNNGKVISNQPFTIIDPDASPTSAICSIKLLPEQDVVVKLPGTSQQCVAHKIPELNHYVYIDRNRTISLIEDNVQNIKAFKGNYTAALMNRTQEYGRYNTGNSVPPGTDPKGTGVKVQTQNSNKSTQSSPFREFVSTEGRFKVGFLGEPRMSEQSLDDYQVGTVKIFYVIEDTKSTYHCNIMYADFPDEAIRKYKTEELFDIGQSWVVRATFKAKAHKIYYEGMPGREVEIDSPNDGLAVCRFFLRGHRLYRPIIANDDKSKMSDPMVYQFLNTFHIIN